MTYSVVYKVDYLTHWHEKEVYLDNVFIGYIARNPHTDLWENKTLFEERFTAMNKDRTRRQCRYDLMDKLNIKRGSND